MKEGRRIRWGGRQGENRDSRSRERVGKSYARKEHLITNNSKQYFTVMIL